MLKICMEYKFSLGGSVFHATEGDRIKVKLGINSGMIIEGEFVGCNGDASTFQVYDDDNNYVNINCSDVIDITPV